MVKLVIALIFMCSFFACSETGKKNDSALPMIENDTFDYFGEENNIPLIPEFSVDTIKSYTKETDYTETLICPRVVEKEFDQINEVLKKEIKRKAALCYTDTTNDEPVDTSKEVFGVTKDNILLKMYKNKNLVSYGFLSESDEPYQMRPFRKYFSINYDIVKKKFIYLSDYFKIITSTDSILFKSLIYGDVGYPDTKRYPLSDQINFSSDKENVYFYFDMFGETGIPMGLVKRVKKKYLTNFINDEYK
jgi:hypothetical protein